MWSILALGVAERLINHFIDLDTVTRIQLNELKGKLLRVVIDSPQLSVDVFFDDQKLRLEATATGQSQSSSIFEQRPFEQENQATKATTILHVQNIIELIKLLFAQDVGNIPLQGDYHLLQDIQRIMNQVEPDLAAHLSPWIGPALAHEIGKIQHAPQHIKRNIRSYLFFAEDALKEDTGIFAPRWQMDDLIQDTRTFNQNLDRAEAKIQQIKAKIEARQKIT
ncbi:hypothetical protein B9T31_11055 [Acinetobacter sp. ANC 4558]|uniref:ubiquinone biosynthesis accessory factor UbiJ n=1 Tax=Acinetobacter sp. ANC 4558 TaxID=1977876 RepID=UPI000A32E419|nr:hypothetical protein [Acinetobacter sp. ANC 4558]OTG85691.1 hypothetical protein B9T31_11055 [Acinetobacter sp. ANC 4558]